MRVGFIGLGLMGRPMAGHLQKAGHELHLWARRPESLVPFRDSGAQLHATPAELAAAVEVVITMVADGSDVAALAFGEQGLAAGAAPGLVVVDMSTIGPSAARDIGSRLATQGIEFVDAPVSGGEKGAIEATLTIMAGGKAEVFERVLPLFNAVGKTVNRIGEIGAGQVAKACNQVLVAAGIAAVAESITLAEQSGVDFAKVREALLGGFAYSRVLENHGQRMLDGNFEPGFKAWMHQKDMRIVLDEAHRGGLMMPIAAAFAQLMNGVVGAGLGEKDSISVLTLLRRIGGKAPR
ncbi:MAG TPA: NAD(P)-dependent oxidoreductase [Rhodocyclaceae bacterium]